MSEASLWNWLRGVLPPGQYSRIESGDTAAGFPDVHYQLTSKAAGTLELKFSHHPNAKYPFKDDDTNGVRLSQLVWIRDNVEYGGTVWIIAQVGDLILIIPGQNVHLINNHTLADLREVAETDFSRKDLKAAATILRSLLLERA